MRERRYVTPVPVAAAKRWTRVGRGRRERRAGERPAPGATATDHAPQCGKRTVAKRAHAHGVELTPTSKSSVTPRWSRAHQPWAKSRPPSRGRARRHGIRTPASGPRGPGSRRSVSTSTGTRARRRQHHQRAVRIEDLTISSLAFTSRDTRPTVSTSGTDGRRAGVPRLPDAGGPPAPRSLASASGDARPWRASARHLRRSRATPWCRSRCEPSSPRASRRRPAWAPLEARVLVRVSGPSTGRRRRGPASPARARRSVARDGELVGCRRPRRGGDTQGARTREAVRDGAAVERPVMKTRAAVDGDVLFSTAASGGRRRRRCRRSTGTLSRSASRRVRRPRSMSGRCGAGGDWRRRGRRPRSPRRGATEERHLARRASPSGTSRSAERRLPPPPWERDDDQQARAVLSHRAGTRSEARSNPAPTGTQRGPAKRTAGVESGE